MPQNKPPTNNKQGKKIVTSIFYWRTTWEAEQQINAPRGECALPLGWYQREYPWEWEELALQPWCIMKRRIRRSASSMFS